MLNDTLQGVRERTTSRWVLLIPLPLIGMFAMFVVATVPWIILDCNGGAVYVFIPHYSLVVFAAIIAPRGKRIVATVFAVLAIVLAHYYILSMDAKSWDEINGQRFRDPDAFNPWSLWFGALAGTASALALVFFRRSARWLLWLPALIAAFDAAFLLGLIVLGPFGNTTGNWIWLPVVACGLIASAAAGYGTVPDYKRRAALFAGLLPLALIAYLLLTADL